DRDAWTAMVAEASRHASDGDTAAAIDALGSAIRLDSTSAIPFWLRARLHDQTHNFDRALADYVAARDRDRLRFRAPTAMNAVIRQEAARTGAIVVETEGRMAAAARDGLIGHDLMTEHLHPNIEGYFQLTAAFY